MTIRNNAKLVATATPTAHSALYIDRQTTDLSDRSFIPAALLLGDSIQIGVVPAGCKLVAHLCAIQVPIIDTSATPTAKYKIGSVAVPDALAAEKIPGAAVSVVATVDFKIGALGFGSATDDTPVYLTLSAAAATPSLVGKIVADLAFRAWDSKFDV